MKVRNRKMETVALHELMSADDIVLVAERLQWNLRILQTELIEEISRKQIQR